MPININDNVPSDAPTNTLIQVINKLVTQLKTVTGQPSWKDAPITSISALSTPIKGDKGDTGEQGIQGANGLDGFGANIPYISGRYYPVSMGGVSAVENVAPYNTTDSYILLRYFCIRKTQEFSRIAARCITGGNLILKLGIYDLDLNYKPKNLIANTGSIICNSSGYKEGVISTILQPKLYCLAQLRIGTGASSMLVYGEDSGLSNFLFGGINTSPGSTVFWSTQSRYSDFPVTIPENDLSMSGFNSQLAAWLKAA